MPTNKNALSAEIAKAIRDTRKKIYPHHGGARQFAQENGYSPQQWSQWERGARTPNKDNLERIDQAFSLYIDDFTSVIDIANYIYYKGKRNDKKVYSPIDTLYNKVDADDTMIKIRKREVINAISQINNCITIIRLYMDELLK